MISLIYIILGVVLLLRKTNLPISKEREITSKKSKVLGVILIAAAALLMLTIDAISDNLQVLSLAGLPIAIIIIALILSAKKPILENSPTPPEASSGQKVVNIITWLILGPIGIWLLYVLFTM